MFGPFLSAAAWTLTSASVRCLTLLPRLIGDKVKAKDYT